MFNRTVKQHTQFIQRETEYTLMSNEQARLKGLQEKATAVKENTMQSRIFQKDKQQSVQEAAELRFKRQIAEDQGPLLLERMIDHGKLLILKDVLFEMYRDALVLDDSFKEAKESHIKHTISEYVDSKGGYALLENAVRTSGSPLLKEMKVLIEKTASKVARRKQAEIKDNQTPVNQIEFELDTDEKKGLDLGKADLNLDRISDMVKAKVLTVIKDEQARQVKEDQLYEDIEAEAQQQNIPAKEASQKIIFNKPVLEESTLFNSIFRNIYKTYVTENISIQTDNTDSGDAFMDALDYDVNAEDKDTVDDGVNFGSEKNSRNDVELINDEEMSIDMDLILAESIANYTLMDLTYTLKLENYTNLDIRNMSHKLLN